MIHKGFLIVVTPTCLSSRGRQIGTWHSWTGTGPCWYALSDTHHFPPYLIKPTCCDAFVGKIDLPVYNQYLSTSSVFNLRDSPLIECSLRKISKSRNTIPWGVRNHFSICCNETKLTIVIIPILCMTSWFWYSQFSCKHAGEHEKNVPFKSFSLEAPPAPTCTMWTQLWYFKIAWNPIRFYWCIWATTEMVNSYFVDCLAKTRFWGHWFRGLCWWFLGSNPFENIRSGNLRSLMRFKLA